MTFTILSFGSDKWSSNEAKFAFNCSLNASHLSAAFAKDKSPNNRIAASLTAGSLLSR